MPSKLSIRKFSSGGIWRSFFSGSNQVARDSSFGTWTQFSSSIAQWRNLSNVGLPYFAKQEVEQLNYITALNAHAFREQFYLIHNIPWEERTNISDNFSLVKRKLFFHEITDKNEFDLVYYDAFGARVQPELWTEDIFAKMYDAMKDGGVLVTYSAKGSVRRAMQTVGFRVERLPGPPGKREMLRAVKVVGDI